MNLEEAAKDWKSRLKDGKPVNRVRVRRLLELKGAERRGSLIMNSIRAIFDDQGLTTEPDFQSVWPDSLVVIKLRPVDRDAMDDATVLQNNGSQTAPVEDLLAPIDEQLAPELEHESSVQDESKSEGETLNSPAGDAGLVEVVTKKELEPFIRVSSVPSANHGLVTILPDDSLTKATTKMMFGGYSQLVIMQGDREVRGLVSWESIAKRSLSDPAPTFVRDCRIDAQVIDSDASLYDALPVVAKHGCVLVRSRDKKFTGIVTASDLSAEFGRSAYAFMCIRTIEVLIRGKLHPQLTQDDLNTLEAHSKARRDSDSSAITFGENVRLLQNPEIWRRLSLGVDQKELTARLQEIKDIRNDVMHFDPGPLSDDKRVKLEQMEYFLKQVLG